MFETRSDCHNVSTLHKNFNPQRYAVSEKACDADVRAWPVSTNKCKLKISGKTPQLFSGNGALGASDWPEEVWALLMQIAEASLMSVKSREEFDKLR